MTNFSFKGTYTCIAKGSKGSVEAETKVDVTGDDDPDNHGKGRDDLDWIDADEEDDYDLWWDPDAGLFLNRTNYIIPYYTMDHYDMDRIIWCILVSYLFEIH